MHCLLSYILLPSFNKPCGDICQSVLTSLSDLQPCGLPGGDVPCVFTQSLGGAHLAVLCPLMLQQGCNECPAPHVTLVHRGVHVAPFPSLALCCLLAQWQVRGCRLPADRQCSMGASEDVGQSDGRWVLSHCGFRICISLIMSKAEHLLIWRRPFVFIFWTLFVRFFRPKAETSVSKVRARAVHFFILFF